MSGTPVANGGGTPALDGPELVAELQRPEVQELLSNHAPALRTLFEGVTGQPAVEGTMTWALVASFLATRNLVPQLLSQEDARALFEGCLYTTLEDSATFDEWLLFLVKLALYRFSSPSFAAHCPGTVHKVALLLHYLGTGAQDDAIAAAEDPWLPAPATALLRDVVGALNPATAQGQSPQQQRPEDDGDASGPPPPPYPGSPALGSPPPSALASPSSPSRRTPRRGEQEGGVEEHVGGHYTEQRAQMRAVEGTHRTPMQSPELGELTFRPRLIRHPGGHESAAARLSFDERMAAAEHRRQRHLVHLKEAMWEKEEGQRRRVVAMSSRSRKLLERRGIGSESRAEFYDRLHKTRAMRRSAAEGGTGDRVVDDENLTFQPAINQSSQRSRSGQRLGGPAGVAGSPGYGGSDSGQGRRPNVGDTLYREAINSRIKLLLLERREEENLRQRRNARKMTATSVRYMMQRLQREVTEAVLAADVDGRGWLTYTQMVATLRTLGFLKRLGTQPLPREERMQELDLCLHLWEMLVPPPEGWEGASLPRRAAYRAHGLSLEVDGQPALVGAVSGRHGESAMDTPPPPPPPPPQDGDMPGDTDQSSDEEEEEAGRADRGHALVAPAGAGAEMSPPPPPPPPPPAHDSASMEGAAAEAEDVAEEEVSLGFGVELRPLRAMLCAIAFPHLSSDGQEGKDGSAGGAGAVAGQQPGGGRGGEEDEDEEGDEEGGEEEEEEEELLRQGRDEEVVQRREQRDKRRELRVLHRALSKRFRALAAHRALHDAQRGSASKSSGMQDARYGPEGSPGTAASLAIVPSSGGSGQRGGRTNLSTEQLAVRDCTFQPALCKRSLQLEKSKRAPTATRRVEMMLAKAKESEQRRLELRRQQEAEKLKNCTFKPQVNTGVSGHSPPGGRGRKARATKAPAKAATPPSFRQSMPRHERLYRMAVERRHKEVATGSPTTEEIERESHCTFQPEITPMKQLAAKPRGKYVPRGYAESVERQRMAWEQRERKKKENEKKLLRTGVDERMPGERLRDASGAIRQAPFRLSTSRRTSEHGKARARARENMHRHQEALRALDRVACLDRPRSEGGASAANSKLAWQQ